MQEPDGSGNVRLNDRLGGWFGCLGAPGRDGKYLTRMDEDEPESEYKVYIVKNGRIFTEDGRERLVWNIEWKRIA